MRIKINNNRGNNVKNKIGIFAIILLASNLLAGGSYAADLTNGDFENGLTNWTYTGGVVVLKEPESTNHVAQLTANATLTSAQFDWSTGDKLTFDWNFIGLQEQGLKDTASYTLSVTSLVSGEFYTEVLASGGETITGWTETPESYVFKDSDPKTGKIIFTMYNGANTNRQDSILQLDNVMLTKAAPVPIPGSALLLGSSLLGLVGIGSRRKTA